MAPSTLAEAGAPAGIRVGLATGGTAERDEVIAREASMVVNHQFSWVGIEPERGVHDFTKADAEYAFARDHHLFQVAMHFAWDQGLLDDMPSWVGDIDDPDELRAVLRHRAEVIFARYPDLQMIDVVNEPFQTVGSDLYRNHFYDVLGPDYIDELFAIVEDVAPPSVELIVNEGGVEYLPKKAANLVALAKHLKAAGHRIDGVGFQTHLAMGDPNWRTLYDAMRKVSDLGLGAYITELDVPTPPTLPRRQAVQDERYRKAAAVCLAVPTCTIFDVWGVSDVPSWYENDVEPGMDPVLFDAGYHPKSSYAALRDALAEGRPADGGPPRFLRERRVRRATGREDTTYPLACQATAAPTRAGYGELSSVTAQYLAGNPMRLPVPAHLRWSPATDGHGTATYAAHLDLDLQAVADRYLIETARPAIGLGGHQDLLPTTWMRITADAPTVSFAPEASAASGHPTMALDAPLRADTRHRVAPTGLDLRWTSDLAPIGDGGIALVDPPTITFDLRVELGVVYAGADVSGTATVPMTCAADGTWLELATSVQVDAATATAGPPAATPITGSASYTG
ncbi:MAG: endo-1,4-beta-xylanase [Acidimicrobiales bacterium]